MASSRSPNNVRVAVQSTSTAPPIVEACRLDCVGRSIADIDGDGRPDKIGLFANPPLSRSIDAHRPSKLAVRVVFANGQVGEYQDAADWDASLVGASDANGDGKAEIFYFNNTGANLHSGYILQWDGSKLAPVLGPNGERFNTLISSYAMGGEGFRCTGDFFITTTIHDDGPSNGWTASKTTYRWRSNQLELVSEREPIPVTQPGRVTGGAFQQPIEYGEIVGAHCRG